MYECLICKKRSNLSKRLSFEWLETKCLNYLLVKHLPRKNLCQTAPRIVKMHISSCNGVTYLSYNLNGLPFLKSGASVQWWEKPRAGNSVIEMCLNASHTLVKQTSCQLYHDPLLHAFLRPMICMHPFFMIFWSFVLLFGFSCPSCFISLFPVFGWMHFLCVCVLSLPVQCWSLSYGKQRRPFRLCAPTWLRQQVWRTFNFFSTWTFLVTALCLFVSEGILLD